MMRLRFPCALLGVLVVSPAAAQMVLPGAAPPTPIGGSESRGGGGGGGGGGGAAQAKPIPVKVFGADAITGHALSLNGGVDRIVFAASAGDDFPPVARPRKAHAQAPAPQPALSLTELKMTGDSIKRPGQDCRVDIRPDVPITAKPLGTPAGLLRYQLDLPACPFSFDVLDGAILTVADTAQCTLTQADCKVNPAGLWGITAAELTPERDKTIERERRGADAAQFQNFKLLVARTKDRALVKTISADQAAFSSRREETCRSYVQESAHGYCAARVTQARAADLQTRLNAALVANPPGKHKRSKGASSGASLGAQE